ncbi:FtsX-like permease family protein [Salicola sp. Rm-C-2C1-2]|uniref:ABC transporter permease n=1 Tax=Salicola sp. Rm-C-2C1-2 TaxID=3141321 RepID=UPI0032E43E45
MSGVHRLGWLSRRDWRQRDVRVVLVSLMVAVAIVATIGLFAEHLQRTIMSSASEFLAADRQLEASHPLPDEFRREAQNRDLATARQISFATMLQGGDAMELVRVRAVDDGYPLRGEVEIQSAPGGPRRMVAHGPGQGEIWVNARLLRLLDVEVGDSVGVGDASLRVAGILVRSPDAGFDLAALAPRVMMHHADVEKAGVVQPGSRVTYRELYAGSESDLKAFQQWLEPKLTSGQRWRSVDDGQAGVSDALERAERFLMLGGSLAVLLAAVAVAVASRQYALGQRDTVALLKTLGLDGRTIGWLYLLRLGLWGIVGTGLGLLLALPLFAVLAHIANRFLDDPVAWQVAPSALLPALVTAFVALFAFAWPPIQRLRRVTAMQVLRAAPGEQGRWILLDLMIAIVAIFGLLWFYSGEVWLVLALLGGLAALLAVLTLLSAGLVSVLGRIRGGNRAWRLALVALYRHRRSGLAQMSVFAMVLMLAATLFLTRSALLEDWHRQLPEDAPNHFLINIAPDKVDEVGDFLEDHGMSFEALYPMVRGRLVRINGKPVRQAVSKHESIGALNRDLNLTWMQELPSDNALERGQWWGESGGEGVSVEAELYTEMGLSMGDALTFRVGAQEVTAEVRSVRSVQWESMRPNFFMVFAPGKLDDLSATWLTSFHLDEGRKELLNELGRTFPAVSILEVDHFIERIRSIIAQVTRAMEALLSMILVSALLVMVAVVSATLGARQREGALLRTLGARRGLLVGSSMLEFALMGLIAGVLGVLAAELAVWALQYRLFEGSFRLHVELWLVLPPVSALVLALMGRWQLSPVLNVSPMLLLRRLES